MLLEKHLHQRLAQVCTQPTCFVGIGNTLRSDDAIGTVIADKLLQDINLLNEKNKVYVINVEDVIENFVYKIAEMSAKNIVLIDAVATAQYGIPAGSVYFQELEELEIKDINQFSTHKLALSMSGKVFREYGKKTWLLGIVVKNTDFGRQINSEVAIVGEQICKSIINIYQQNIN